MGGFFWIVPRFPHVCRRDQFTYHSEVIGRIFFGVCNFCEQTKLLVMAKLALVLFLVVLFQIITVHAVYTEDKCIKGQWHKASPSPETKEFKTCHAFKDSSCCTAEFTVELMANETRSLYNHSWHRCGQLSQKCQKFWITQVSFRVKFIKIFPNCSRAINLSMHACSHFLLDFVSSQKFSYPMPRVVF